jgi:hypothetical protein
MKRMTLNFIVDLIAFIDFIAQAVTGFIIKYILPPGSGGGFGQGQGYRGGRGPQEIREFLSMTRHEWGDIHFIFSIIFIVLILIHLVLHWNWIKACTKTFMKCPVQEGG